MKEVTMRVSLDTTKLQRILSAVSKHAGALAEELAEIDATMICDCGGLDFACTDIDVDDYHEWKCMDCGESCAVKTKEDE